MELLTNNPGFQHVAEEIFQNLNSKNLKKCTCVNDRWENIINNPSFYLKKCLQFGILEKYANEWKKAIQFTDNSEFSLAILKTCYGTMRLTPHTAC